LVFYNQVENRQGDQKKQKRKNQDFTPY